VKPRVFGWFPGGPAVALAADLRVPGAVELSGADVTEACMAFSDAVGAVVVRHNGDPLLTRHAGQSEKYRQGDAWRFQRPRLGGNVDAAYAAAGACLLARQVAGKKRRGPLFIS
jgi:hypothetical protein